MYDPFGEDDQDFELNELLNRHFKVCMTIVDENEFPELKKGNNNFIDKILLEINHKIFPKEDKANNLFRYILEPD